MKTEIKGESTSNTIFILRTIIKHSLKINKDFYLGLIEKSFDRVIHEDMAQMLKKNLI